MLKTKLAANDDSIGTNVINSSSLRRKFYFHLSLPPHTHKFRMARCQLKLFYFFRLLAKIEILHLLGGLSRRRAIITSLFLFSTVCLFNGRM